MPQIVIPTYTIDYTVAENAGTVDVAVEVTTSFPWSGDPLRPERLAVYLDGQWVKNEYGAAGSTPYKKAYNFTISKAASLDPLSIGEAAFILQTAGGNGTSQKTVHRWTSPLTPDGAVVPQLVPGKILRTLFWNSIDDFVATPARATQFRDAGVNAVTFSIFNNPVHSGGGVTNYQQWLDQTVLNATGLQAKIDWCAAEGFHLVGAGDDICRTQTERDWVANTPWAQQCIEETASRLAAGPCPYVAMVDEMGGVPTDYPVLADLMSWWRGAGGPAVGFPFQRQPGDPFEELPWSDVNDRYWSVFEATLGGENETPTRWQVLSRIKNAGNGLPHASRPGIMQIGVMGPQYKKLVAGGNYQPGLDHLWRNGVDDPALIVDQVKLAMAYGVCGLRAYAFDLNGTNSRNAAPIGSTLETGIQIGSAKWAALSEAFHWIASNEAALCGPFLPPVVDGAVVTGRRDGLSWTVDMLE